MSECEHAIKTTHSRYKQQRSRTSYLLAVDLAHFPWLTAFCVLLMDTDAIQHKYMRITIVTITFHPFTSIKTQYYNY